MDKKTIVLLDRDTNVCTTLKRMLETAGHTVFAATVPGDLLAELSKRPVDVVLTNRVLGSFEGEASLLETVRAMQPQTAIVLTAHGIGERDEAAPFDAILPQPFTMIDVREVVATVTRRR